jgi:hypothetical protein
MNQYKNLTMKEVEELLLKDPDNEELVEMVKHHKEFIKKLKWVNEPNNQKYYRR